MHSEPEAFVCCLLACFALEGLSVDRSDQNHVACGECRARWQVGLDTTLEGCGDAPTLTVRDAYDQVAEHFGSPPVEDPDQFNSTGVALRSPAGQVFKVRDNRHGVDPLIDGELRLLTDRLVVMSGPDEERWSLPLRDTIAVSVELGNKVQVRTQSERFQVLPGGESVLKWGHFLNAWRAHVLGIDHAGMG